MFQRYPTVKESPILVMFECVVTFVFECKMRLMSGSRLQRAGHAAALPDQLLRLEAVQCRGCGLRELEGRRL